MLSIPVDAVKHRTVEIVGGAVVRLRGEAAVTALARHHTGVRTVLDVTSMEGVVEVRVFWSSGPSLDTLVTEPSASIVRTTVGAEVSDFDQEILPCVGVVVELRNMAGVGAASVGLRVLCLQSR